MQLFYTKKLENNYNIKIKALSTFNKIKELILKKLRCLSLN